MADVAITVRVPEELKEALNSYAATRGQSLAAVVRDALSALIAPAAERPYELPGLSRAFNEFLASKQFALLLVSSGRERFHVEGRLDLDLTNESLVSLFLRGDDHSTTFLRRDVVGWFEGDDRANRLAMRFSRFGWPPYRVYGA